MLQHIDFLPAAYRQARERRKKNLWRNCALVTGTVFTIVVGVHEHRSLQQLRATRDRLQQQAETLEKQLRDPSEWQRHIVQLDARANLITLLRLRPRATPILNAVVHSLPQFVSISDLRITREEISNATPSSQSVGGAVLGAAANSEEDTRSKTEHDVERLHKKRRGLAVFVLVGGVAPNDVAISGYLAALAETRLFDDVELLYTDRHIHRDLTLRKFEIRLRLRGPYSDNLSSVQLAGKEAL